MHSSASLFHSTSSSPPSSIDASSVLPSPSSKSSDPRLAQRKGPNVLAGRPMRSSIGMPNSPLLLGRSPRLPSTHSPSVSPALRASTPLLRSAHQLPQQQPQLYHPHDAASFALAPSPALHPSLQSSSFLAPALSSSSSSSIFSSSLVELNPPPQPSMSMFPSSSLDSQSNNEHVPSSSLLSQPNAEEDYLLAIAEKQLRLGHRLPKKNVSSANLDDTIVDASNEEDRMEQTKTDEKKKAKQMKAKSRKRKRKHSERSLDATEQTERRKHRRRSRASGQRQLRLKEGDNQTGAEREVRRNITERKISGAAIKQRRTSTRLLNHSLSNPKQSQTELETESDHSSSDSASSSCSSDSSSSSDLDPASDVERAYAELGDAASGMLALLGPPSTAVQAGSIMGLLAATSTTTDTSSISSSSSSFSSSSSSSSSSPPSSSPESVADAVSKVPRQLRTVRELMLDQKSGDLSSSKLKRIENQKKDRMAMRAAKKQQRNALQTNSVALSEESEMKQDSRIEAPMSNVEDEKGEYKSDALQSAPTGAHSRSGGEQMDVRADVEGEEEKLDEEDADDSQPANAVSIAMAPQMKIVNGQIVLNEESLVLHSAEGVASESYALIHENSTHRLSSSSFSKHVRVDRWTAQETALFYKSLTQFGTDFTLIACLMPGRDRKQIKSKYKKEEKLNRFLIEAALNRRTEIDVVRFEELKKAKEDGEKAKQAVSDEQKKADSQRRTIESVPIQPDL